MVTALTYYPVELPCEFDFVISRGSTTVGRSIFAELSYPHQGKTLTGMGEAVPPLFYGESPESVMDFLSWIQEENLLNTITPFDIQRFHDTMSRIPGNMSAKAALDMALYDLLGQVTGLPLYKLWGLDTNRIPKSSYTIGMADLDQIRHKTQVALSRGYDILKVKVGGNQDLETLKIIRDTVPEETVIRVDANAAWTPQEAVAMFDKLAPFNIEFIEEPLQPETPPKDRQSVKASCPFPILADESVHTLRDIPLVADWADGVNLKLPKTGGLTEAHRMIHAARAHNLSIMLGCFAESSLSITAFAHLAPLVDYLDLDGALLLANDPIEGVTWNGSQLSLPDRPGLGIRKREVALRV